MTKNQLSALSAKQLRRAAAIRGHIDRLEGQLTRLLGGASGSAPTGAPRRKRKMSRAAKARISAAMKARWAKRKAGKK